MLNLFFKPGMKLMRHMSFPAKMLLMALVLALPLAWLTMNLLQSVRQDLMATRSELLGSAVVAPAIDVALQVQRHRSLLQRRLGGDAGTQADLASTRARLKAARAERGACNGANARTLGPASLRRLPAGRPACLTTAVTSRPGLRALSTPRC